MTLHQLRIFKVVAEHLSVTRAADELHLSQPCVSAQLKLLESEFEVEFYRKKAPGIILTEHGALLLKKIRSILEQVDELKKLISEGEKEPTMVNLEIGSTQYPSAFLLPEVLKTFRTKHPDINVTLRIAQSSVIEQMVLNGKIAIGIVSNPSYNPNLSMEFSCAEEVVAVVSPKHPLAKKRVLTTEELGRIPALVRMNGLIVKELQNAGLKLNISMECESSEAIKAAVESGLGAGFFYRSTVENSLKAGHFKALQIPALNNITVRSVIIYLRSRVLPAHAQIFLTLLRERVLKSYKRFKVPKAS